MTVKRVSECSANWGDLGSQPVSAAFDSLAGGCGCSGSTPRSHDSPTCCGPVRVRVRVFKLEIVGRRVTANVTMDEDTMWKQMFDQVKDKEMVHRMKTDHEIRYLH